MTFFLCQFISPASFFLTVASYSMAWMCHNVTTALYMVFFSIFFSGNINNAALNWWYKQRHTKLLGYIACAFALLIETAKSPSKTLHRFYPSMSNMRVSVFPAADVRTKELLKYLFLWLCTLLSPSDALLSVQQALQSSLDAFSPATKAIAVFHWLCASLLYCLITQQPAENQFWVPCSLSPDQWGNRCEAPSVHGARSACRPHRLVPGLL